MDTIKDARLHRCPFCGGEAVLRIIEHGDWDWDEEPEVPRRWVEVPEGTYYEDDDDENAAEELEEQYMPICTKCNASFFYDGPTFYTKEQAIEAWNKRV